MDTMAYDISFILYFVAVWALYTDTHWRCQVNIEHFAYNWYGIIKLAFFKLSK